MTDKAFRYDWMNWLVDGPRDAANRFADTAIQTAKDLYGTFTDDKYWYGGYDDPTKESRFAFWYSVPGVQNMIDYRLDNVKWDLYSNRYGLDDSDVLDPRNKPTSSSQQRVVRYGLNFVSDNIRRLYR